MQPTRRKKCRRRWRKVARAGGGELADLRSCDSDSDDNVASSSGTVADRERSMSDRERSDAENFGSEGEATDTEVPEPTAPWQQKRVTGSQLEEAVKMQRDESDEQQAKRNQALAKQLWQRGTKLWKEISEAESQLRAVKEKIIILGTKVRKATGNWSYTKEAARKKMCRTPGKKSIKQIYAKWERIKQIYDKMSPKTKREKVRCRHAGELAGHERDARHADGRGSRREESPASLDQGVKVRGGNCEKKLVDEAGKQAASRSRCRSEREIIESDQGPQEGSDGFEKALWAVGEGCRH